tara:strand:- start:53507 stop:53737 length:231 start_codon:yes stop_codon:yes gene_type:complete
MIDAVEKHGSHNYSSQHHYGGVQNLFTSGPYNVSQLFAAFFNELNHGYTTYFAGRERIELSSRVLETPILAIELPA